MKLLKYAVITLASAFISSTVFANSFNNYQNYKKSNGEYEVTITNLTYNQIFSPPLVVSHRRSISLFEAGEAASEAIAIMAEAGDVSAIIDSLSSDNRVRSTETASGPILPGKSTTVTLPVNKGGRLSVVSMLVNTNDAFLALNNIRAPRHGRTVTLYAVAYDAGTEVNDELCSNIPGPACGGEGFSPVDGEGFIHIHRGMHGIGTLAADAYDWRNPVARITITRQ